MLPMTQPPATSGVNSRRLESLSVPAGSVSGSVSPCVVTTQLSWTPCGHCSLGLFSQAVGQQPSTAAAAANVLATLTPDTSLHTSSKNLRPTGLRKLAQPAPPAMHWAMGHVSAEVQLLQKVASAGEPFATARPPKNTGAKPATFCCVSQQQSFWHEKMPACNTPTEASNASSSVGKSRQEQAEPPLRSHQMFEAVLWSAKNKSESHDTRDGFPGSAYRLTKSSSPTWWQSPGKM
mmetsp:Transcript_9891/g.23306  ORF Transcript_9891/g.23306 Transcript_9891/m.23306 type:complete len:235 (-) Transcript_9891:1075-1779(-)